MLVAINFEYKKRLANITPILGLYSNMAFSALGASARQIFSLIRFLYTFSLKLSLTACKTSLLSIFLVSTLVDEPLIRLHNSTLSDVRPSYNAALCLLPPTEATSLLLVLFRIMSDEI